MDTITTADLAAIDALAKVADRLPKILSARIERGTVHLHVYLAADAAATAALLGLTDRTTRRHDYPDGGVSDGMVTRTEWTLLGQPFVVVHVTISSHTEAA